MSIVSKNSSSNSSENSNNEKNTSNDKNSISENKIRQPQLRAFKVWGLFRSSGCSSVEERISL